MTEIKGRLSGKWRSRPISIKTYFPTMSSANAFSAFIENLNGATERHRTLLGECRSQFTISTVGISFEAFNRDISLLFHVVTRTPEGDIYELYEVHEIGDLIEAKKCWRKVVRQHPSWHHSIQLGNGTDVLHNDPAHNGKKPKEVWVSRLHRGACE